MKQKLGIACSLVSKPELLILDEPTAGVDPLSRKELWDVLSKVAKVRNTSVLISTGYMDEAARCDRIYILNEGKVLSTGTLGVDFSLSKPGFLSALCGKRYKKAS